MAGEDLIHIGRDTADFASGQLKNIFAQQYSAEVDSMFGRLHEKLDAGKEAKSYNASEYKRVAFNSQGAAARFAQEMKEQDVKVAIAPVRFNGQYLAEIPNYTEILVSPDYTNDDKNYNAYNQNQSQNNMRNNELYNNDSNSAETNNERKAEQTHSTTSSSINYSNTENNNYESNNIPLENTDNHNSSSNVSSYGMPNSFGSNELEKQNFSGKDSVQIPSDKNLSSPVNELDDKADTKHKEISEYPDNYVPLKNSIDDLQYDDSHKTFYTNNAKENLQYDNSQQKENPNNNSRKHENKDVNNSSNKEESKNPKPFQPYTRMISADELIENFKEKTFEKVKDVSEVKDNGGDRSPVSVESAASHFTKNLDYFGSFINKALKIAKVPENYGMNQNEKLFTQKMKIGQDNPRLNTKESNRAYVLNGDIVVIDGEIIKDEKRREYVLKQHKEREKTALKHIEKSENRFEKYGKREDQRFAKYQVEEKAREKEWLKKHPEEKYKSKKYKASKPENKTQKLIRKNSQKIIQGIYRQEYVADTAINAASRNGGTLDNITKNINTEAIALSLSGEIISLEPDVFSLLKRATENGYATGRQMAELVDVLNGNDVTTFRERFAITEVFKKMSNATQKGKAKLSDQEQETLKKATDEKYGIKLNDVENEMFTKSRTIMNNLEKDLGLDFTNGSITREDVLKINEVFLKRAEEKGYQFTKDGTASVLKGANLSFKGKSTAVFDVKALQNLTVADMKELGITHQTRDIIADLNQKGSWGEKRKNNASLRQMAMSGFLKIADDEELSDAISGLRKAKSVPRYVKSASTSISQFSKAVSYRVDASKAKRVGKAGKDIKAKKKPPILRKQTKQKPIPLNPKANEKFLKAQQKKLKKLKNSEKSMITKFKNTKGKLLKKFSQNKVAVLFNKIKLKAAALLIKVAAIWLALVVIIAAAVIAVILIISLIQSLANAPFTFIDGLLAAQDHSETACYKLYEYLSEEEESWVDLAGDFGGLYDSKSELKYGVEYKSYDEYLTAFNNLLKGDEDALYINPFWKAGDLVTPTNANKRALTKTSSFDGIRSSELSANINVYGKKVALDEAGNYTSTQSGHTSNIKDILAMTDVMYQFDMDGMFDGGEGEGLNGILGMAPAQINWRNFTNNFLGTIKWAVSNTGKFFGNFFGSGEDEEYEDRTIFIGDTCSYATIQNYVTSLFEASHQRQLSMKVEYYPVKEGVDINVNGEMSQVKVPQSEASELGMCLNPVTKKFPIHYDISRKKIIPVLIAEDGSVYDLSTGLYDVTLSMTNGTYTDDRETCIWDGMGSNEETYVKIKEQISSGTLFCWRENTDGTSTVDIEKYQTGGWWDSENNAKVESYNLLVEQYNNYLANQDTMGTTEHILSSSHDNFTKKWYEVNGSWNSNVNYTTTTKEVEDGVEVKTIYFYSLKSTITGKIIELGSSEIKDDPHFTKEEKGFDLVIEEKEETIPKYKIQYKTTANAVIYRCHTESYIRNCEGHNFTYCGGHICMHSQGIVFSATNEQLALAAMYEHSDYTPVIKDFDFDLYGYKGLKGKYDNSENRIDYSTALNASNSGGSKSPLFDIQGSYPAQRGLNLYIEEEEFAKGMKYRNDDCTHLIRDIFDVDCMIDKGKNIFPTGSKYKEYKGWNEENMTLALLRITQNWYDFYGFDIPYEVGVLAVSEEDIDKIVESLKSSYGVTFNEEREAAVRLALRWVGRGHYSEDHKDHAFLSELCDATNTIRIDGEGNITEISYDANCTAGDSEDFVKFILHRSGKMPDVSNDITNWYAISSPVEAEPADILKHQSSSDYRQLEFKSAIPNNASMIDIGRTIDALKSYQKTNYVFYVGTINEDITLDNGLTLKAGIPITVDLNKSDDIGNIYLRCYSSRDWGDLKGDRNYYWVEHPDGKTFVKRFD